MSEIFFIIVVLWIIANAAAPTIIVLNLDEDWNFSFVNPIVIYDNLLVNWFGAWLLAIVLNVLLPTVSIPYWIYKICTVGRND